MGKTWTKFRKIRRQPTKTNQKQKIDDCGIWLRQESYCAHAHTHYAYGVFRYYSYFYAFLSSRTSPRSFINWCVCGMSYVFYYICAWACQYVRVCIVRALYVHVHLYKYNVHVCRIYTIKFIYSQLNMLACLWIEMRAIFRVNMCTIKSAKHTRISEFY